MTQTNEMITKAAVNDRLNSFESKIKEECKKLEKEIKALEESCTTEDMKSILKASAKYAALRARWSALIEVHWTLIDIKDDVDGFTF